MTNAQVEAVYTQVLASATPSAVVEVVYTEALTSVTPSAVVEVVYTEVLTAAWKTTAAFPIEIGLTAAAEAVASTTTTASFPVSVGLSAAASAVLTATATLPVAIGLSAVGSPSTTTSAQLALSVGMSARVVSVTTSTFPIAVGLTATGAVILTTTATLPVGVGLTVTGLVVSDIITTATFPISVGFIAATNAYTIPAWDADLSQQALAGLEALAAPPILVLPLSDGPVIPFVEQQFGVQVHDMPPITVANGRAVPSLGPGVDPDYTITRAALGVPHVFVDGVDVTYWRGIPTQIHSYSLIEPGGEEVAEVSFPQVTPFDSTGEAGDELYWLGADRDLEIVFVDDEGTRYSAWNGILVSDESAVASRSVSADWHAVGLLFGQASATVHQVVTYLPPTDIGHLIPDLLNAIPGRRFAPLARVTTSIMTRLRGSAGESVWDYVKRILSDAWTDDQEQWTIRRTGVKQYALVLKDDTVDYIVQAGQPGVEATLSRDKTQAPNVIFGRGRNSDGGYWEYRRYPDLLLEPAPSFPGTISVGSSGSGVTSALARMSSVGYDVSVDGTFSDSDAAVISRMQADYGLTVTGTIDSATWSMLFDTGPTSGDLDGSYRLPLAIDPKVDPYLRAPNGVIIGDRPEYDPKVQRTEVDVDFGTDITFGEAAEQARKMLPREENAGVTGSLNLLLDPMVPGGTVTFANSRFLMNSGCTVEYRNFRGGDFSTGFEPWKLRAARVQVNLDSLVVSLDADSKRRDAMTLASIMRRDRDAQADPARRPGNVNRRSRQAPDSIVEYDDEARGGIIPEHAVPGGQWKIYPRHLATIGRIAKIEYQLQSDGCIAMFGLEITPAQLTSLAGNPLASMTAFSDNIDALEAYGFIEAWGNQNDPIGYYPGQKSSGDPFTGSFKDTNTVEYASGHPPWIWFCEWVTSDGNVSGRIYPASNP